MERHLARFPDDLIDDGPCYDFRSAVENVHDLTVEIDSLKGDVNLSDDLEDAVADRRRALRRASTSRASCARKVARRGERLSHQAQRLPKLPDKL